MTLTVDLTRNGATTGLRAIVTSETGIPGKHWNDRIVVVTVELSQPWSLNEVLSGRGGLDFCRYKKVVATTSEGIRFVWDDATFGATDRGGHAQRYGSVGEPPWNWGDAEWKALFEEK